MKRWGFVVLLAMLAWPADARAQVFARADDTRAKPPERRKRPPRFTVEARVGGTHLWGNVDHLSINGSLSLGVRLASHSEIFLDGASAHAFFDGEAKIDKDKGSLLYVFKLARHWNLYAQSTHSRNRFLSLDYRTSNSVGVCLHGFGGGFLRPILVSLGVTPEIEWWEDGSRGFTPRATLRLNYGLPVGPVTFGADVIVAPALTSIRDVRLFVENYVELKLYRDLLAMRLVLSEEYDSRPRPGVRRSDVALSPMVVVRGKR
jgi:hypothetical protein